MEEVLTVIFLLPDHLLDWQVTPSLLSTKMKQTEVKIDTTSNARVSINFLRVLQQQ